MIRCDNKNCNHCKKTIFGFMCDKPVDSNNRPIKDKKETSGIFKNGYLK